MCLTDVSYCPALASDPVPESPLQEPTCSGGFFTPQPARKIVEEIKARPLAAARSEADRSFAITWPFCPGGG
jgi:hypothetical protein